MESHRCITSRIVITYHPFFSLFSSERFRVRQNLVSVVTAFLNVLLFWILPEFWSCHRCYSRNSGRMLVKNTDTFDASCLSVKVQRVADKLNWRTIIANSCMKASESATNDDTIAKELTVRNKNILAATYLKAYTDVESWSTLDSWY